LKKAAVLWVFQGWLGLEELQVLLVLQALQGFKGFREFQVRQASWIFLISLH
jgi:hypothetical protein